MKSKQPKKIGTYLLQRSVARYQSVTHTSESSWLTFLWTPGVVVRIRVDAGVYTRDVM